MKTKLTLWAALGMMFLACCFSGCQSSKIAYGNSYYFKQTPKPVAEPRLSTPLAEQSAAPLAEGNLQASVEKDASSHNDAATRLQEARQQIATVVAESNNPALKASVARTQQLAGELKNDQLTRKETRATRKEIRKELRTLTREFRHAAPDATQELDQYLKYALILLGLALLLSIISGVAGLGVLWILASVAGIASAVFFILWLVEEVG